MDHWFEAEEEAKPIKLKVERKYRKKSTFPFNPENLDFPKKTHFAFGDENVSPQRVVSSIFPNIFKGTNGPEESKPTPLSKENAGKETGEAKNSENPIDSRKSEDSQGTNQVEFAVKAEESGQAGKSKPVFEETIVIREEDLLEPTKCRKWTTFTIAIICIFLYALILGTLLYISIEYKSWDEIFNEQKSKGDKKTTITTSTTSTTTTTSSTTTLTTPPP